MFQKAVTARMCTRKKVGAHLSGGLDSGSVVSFTAKALQEKNKNYRLIVMFLLMTLFNGQKGIEFRRPLIESTVQHVGNTPKSI